MIRGRMIRGRVMRGRVMPDGRMGAKWLQSKRDWGSIVMVQFAVASVSWSVASSGG